MTTKDTADATAEQTPLRHDSSVRKLLVADFEALIGIDHVKHRGLRRTFDVLTQAGFLSVVVFRLAHAAHLRGWFPVARLLLLTGVVLFSAEIYPQAQIGPGLIVAHPMGIAIGAGVVMGNNVKVFKNVSVGTVGFKDPDRDGFPVIGSNCTLFDGAKLFGPITLGDGCRVGANALLMRSIPAGSTVVVPQAELLGD